MLIWTKKKKKHTATGLVCTGKPQSNPEVSWTHPLHSLNVECWCVTTKQMASNHDESIRDWMIQMKILEQKWVGVGVWRVDFLHQSSYCTQSWTHSQQATMEFKTEQQKKKHGWEKGFPLYSILHPPIASLFNRTFLKADTLPLGFLVLINDWVTGPTHSPEFLEFGPVALIKPSRRDTQHLL